MIIAAIFFISTKGGTIMLGKDFENIIGCKTLIAVNNIKNKARIYFSGQQLFTVTGYLGLNPEINNNEAGKGLSWSGMGVDMTTYPIPRTFTIDLA